MKIIVYDFDKTIYNGETNLDFTKFMLKKKIYLLPIILYYSLKSLVYIKNLKKSKEILFSFLKGYTKEELDKLSEEFWEDRMNSIFPYFYNEIEKNKKEADKLILISASPTFILQYISKKLGFDDLIATDFEFKNNKFTSNILGENCKGKNKVNKLNKLYTEYEFISFYSDSISDKPLYDISKNKYTIENGILKEGMPLKKTFVDWLK